MRPFVTKGGVASEYTRTFPSPLLPSSPGHTPRIIRLYYKCTLLVGFASLIRQTSIPRAVSRITNGAPRRHPTYLVFHAEIPTPYRPCARARVTPRCRDISSNSFSLWDAAICPWTVPSTFSCGANSFTCMPSCLAGMCGSIFAICGSPP